MKGPRIVAIWTRDIDEGHSAGRLKIARRIRDVIDSLGPALHVRLTTLLDRRSLTEIAAAGLKLQPLQCALFDTRHNRQLANLAAAAEVIYLDGVRTISVLRSLRGAGLKTRIVVDFDDLMSRRMALLDEAKLGLSLGYLTHRFPPAAVSVIEASSRAIVKYEALTLRRAEEEVMALADDVVLLSSLEAAALDRNRSSASRARVHHVGPSEPVVCGPKTIVPPVRFFFIGMDALTQNRLTIEYLLRLWREHRITTPLYLVGKLSRRYDFPEHVVPLGYVDDLNDVYDDRSVLLSPSFLGGGVKTKILEAFARGTPVIGNRLSFEGMRLSEYPLEVADDALPEMLRNPAAYIEAFNAAARLGADYVRRYHDPNVFWEAWRSIISG